jgi:hypothetical protein
LPADIHVFLKPMVTKAAATEYGFDFAYKSRPAWPTYASLLAFCDRVGATCAQCLACAHVTASISSRFCGVLGSSEYP